MHVGATPTVATTARHVQGPRKQWQLQSASLRGVTSVGLCCLRPFATLCVVCVVTCVCKSGYVCMCMFAWVPVQWYVCAHAGCALQCLCICRVLSLVIVSTELSLIAEAELVTIPALWMKRLRNHRRQHPPRRQRCVNVNLLHLCEWCANLGLTCVCIFRVCNVQR